MHEKNPHWTFHIEVLSRAINDLEATCSAAPGSAEFTFLRSEAPVIITEAKEAISALKRQVYELERARSSNISMGT